MKKVLMLLQSDFPPDMRVQKEALSLQKSGYKVTILCDNRVKKRQNENYRGINIIRMRNISLLNGKVHNIINMPVFPNPVWITAALGNAGKIKADIIHVHDLPLAPVGLLIGKILKVPVVLDMHENYPAALKQWYKPGISGWTVRNPYFAEKLEKICLKLSDKIIVIDNVHKNLLVKRGFPKDKIYIVPNVPDVEFINLKGPSQEFINKYNKYYKLVYFGKLNPERNLELAIKAVPILKNKIANMKLIIIGHGPDMKALRKFSDDLHVNDNVEFTGWLDVEDAIKFIDIADICIIPHFSNDNMDIGVPNKLFEYMARGKPVVVPRSEAIAHVVSKVNCGVIFTPDVLDSYVNAIIKIYESDFKYGYFGKKAVEKEYNWNNAEKELLRAYYGI